MKLYEVAVAAPLAGTLTYGQPTTGAEAPIGIRVLVPLGRRLVTGYVLAVIDKDPDDFPYKIKSIVDLLDPDPLFPEQLIPFFRWIADYYHHPLGEVITTALPAGLIVRSGREIFLTDAGREHLPVAIEKVKKQAAWMHKLIDKGKLTPGTVNRVWRKVSMQRLLKNGRIAVGLR